MLSLLFGVALRVRLRGGNLKPSLCLIMRRAHTTVVEDVATKSSTSKVPLSFRLTCVQMFYNPFKVIIHSFVFFKRLKGAVGVSGVGWVAATSFTTNVRFPWKDTLENVKGACAMPLTRTGPHPGTPHSSQYSKHLNFHWDQVAQ